MSAKRLRTLRSVFVLGLGKTCGDFTMVQTYIEIGTQSDLPRQFHILQSFLKVISMGGSESVAAPVLLKFVQNEGTVIGISQSGAKNFELGMLVALPLMPFAASSLPGFRSMNSTIIVIVAPQPPPQARPHFPSLSQRKADSQFLPIVLRTSNHPQQSP